MQPSDAVPSASPPIVTLTTDFGTRDPYVAQMKGVILARCPRAHVVDLTHEIAPQDVIEGALFLATAVPQFPPGTVHIAVVDPGVGTSRRAIAARAGKQLIVCPDNGLPGLLAGPHAVTVAREIASRDFMLPEVSATFHGRDVFAPAAARLAAGAPLDAAGPAVAPGALTPLTLPTPRPARAGEPVGAGRDGVVGAVIHVDRFGNAVTNLHVDDLPEGERICIAAGRRVPLVRTYGEVAAGEPLALFGSTGLLEVAVNRGNAAALLGLARGDEVTIEPSAG